MQDEYDIEVDWRGFQLHPQTPPGGMELSDLYGAGRVAQMHEYLRRFAAAFGITEMHISPRLPNTRPALAAAEHARDRGRLEAFRGAVMDAYWREGRDIEAEPVLREVAGAVGLDPDAIAAAMHDRACLDRIDAVRREAGAAGVTGIPTFFIGAERVVGCQPYETLAAAVEREGGARRS